VNLLAKFKGTRLYHSLESADLEEQDSTGKYPEQGTCRVQADRSPSCSCTEEDHPYSDRPLASGSLLSSVYEGHKTIRMFLKKSCHLWFKWGEAPFPIGQADLRACNNHQTSLQRVYILHRRRDQHLDP
jgi:hypothetical protein